MTGENLRPEAIKLQKRLLDAASKSGCTAEEITQAAAILIANVINMANMGYTAGQIEAAVRLFAATDATHEGRQ
jgi:hypothetical protein